MRNSLKALGLAALLAVTPSVYAEDEELASRSPHDKFIGVGMFDDMLHFNGEIATDYGNFIVRLGKFTEATDGAVGNIGWRKPLTGEDGQTSGYYIGGFIGHVRVDTLGGEVHNRLGLGADLGYHWLNDNTRKILSVGLGTAESVAAGGKKIEAEPYLFFNFSVAIGI